MRGIKLFLCTTRENSSTIPLIIVLVRNLALRTYNQPFDASCSLTNKLSSSQCWYYYLSNFTPLPCDVRMTPHCVSVTCFSCMITLFHHIHQGSAPIRACMPHIPIRLPLSASDSYAPSAITGVYIMWHPDHQHSQPPDVTSGTHNRGSSHAHI